MHYTQAFLDNGYDDLEVCKQIGDPDLDAIGVDRHEDRQSVLDAVKILREEGGTAVYFTLENPAEYQDGNGLYMDYLGLGQASALDLPEKLLAPPVPVPREIERTQGEGTILTYPKIQLTSIVRDFLAREDINLAAAPYVNKVGKTKVLINGPLTRLPAEMFYLSVFMIYRKTA